MAKHNRKPGSFKQTSTEDPKAKPATPEPEKAKDALKPAAETKPKPKRDLARDAMASIDKAIRELEAASKDDRKAFYARDGAPNGNARAVQLRSGLEGILPRLNALIIAGA